MATVLMRSTLINAFPPKNYTDEDTGTLQQNKIFMTQPFAQQLKAFNL
jgi:hypothetical protein